MLGVGTSVDTPLSLSTWGLIRQWTNLLESRWGLGSLVTELKRDSGNLPFDVLQPKGVDWYIFFKDLIVHYKCTLILQHLNSPEFASGLQLHRHSKLHPWLEWIPLPNSRKTNVWTCLEFLTAWAPAKRKQRLQFVSSSSSWMKHFSTITLHFPWSICVHFPLKVCIVRLWLIPQWIESQSWPWVELGPRVVIFYHSVSAKKTESNPKILQVAYPDFSLRQIMGFVWGIMGFLRVFLRVFNFQDLLEYGICMGRIWDFTGWIWDFMGRIWDILIFDLKTSIDSKMVTEKTNSFHYLIPKFDSAAGQTFLGSRKILKSIRTWDGFPPMFWQVQTCPQPQIGNHLWQSSLLEQALIILPSFLHSEDPSWHWRWVWVPSATVHQVIP